MPELNWLLRVLVIALIVVVVAWIVMKLFTALLTVVIIAGLAYLILVVVDFFLPVPR